jgi:hypothetical protein
LKVKCDEPLSKFAFKFNLRRYSLDKSELMAAATAALAADQSQYDTARPVGMKPGRQVQVEPIKSTLKNPGSKLLKVQYGEPLSKFAFNFNLRRYNSGTPTTSRPRSSASTATWAKTISVWASRSSR